MTTSRRKRRQYKDANNCKTVHQVRRMNRQEAVEPCSTRCVGFSIVKTLTQRRRKKNITETVTLKKPSAITNTPLQTSVISIYIYRYTFSSLHHVSSIVEPFVKREFTVVTITSMSRSESLGPRKETSSSSNHPFSGALDVSLRAG